MCSVNLDEEEKEEGVKRPSITQKIFTSQDRAVWVSFMLWQGFSGFLLNNACRIRSHYNEALHEILVHSRSNSFSGMNRSNEQELTVSLLPLPSLYIYFILFILFYYFSFSTFLERERAIWSSPVITPLKPHFSHSELTLGIV